jgi:hypothetical protein
VQRRVHTYRDYIDIERLRKRIAELNAAGKMDKEIAAILNREGFVAARTCAFKGENVWLLRTCWGIPTVKINGAGANPMRWPDGTFSAHGAAVALGITAQTVFKYLKRGLLSGRQLTKGQPWQIKLTDDQIDRLRVSRSRIFDDASGSVFDGRLEWVAGRAPTRSRVPSCSLPSRTLRAAGGDGPKTGHP